MRSMEAVKKPKYLKQWRAVGSSSKTSLRMVTIGSSWTIEESSVEVGGMEESEALEEEEEEEEDIRG